MHPQAIRGGKAATFVLNPAGSKLCFVGLYGPRKRQSVGWHFQVNARNIRLTLLTRPSAAPGSWRLRASCQSRGLESAASFVRLRVMSHGRGLLARHGDLRVLVLEGQPLAKKYLPRGGGEIATRGIRLRVPHGVLRRPSWVTVSRLQPNRYDVRIWGPWQGHVKVTLKPSAATRVPHNVVSHLIGGEWVVESARLGQLTVNVNHLSPFGAIGGFISRQKWVICASSIAGLFIPGVDVAAADAAIACLKAAGQQALSWGIGQVLIRILHVPGCAPTSVFQLFTKACTVYAPSPPRGAQPVNQPSPGGSSGSAGGGGSSGGGSGSGGSGGSSGGGGAGGSASISASRGGPYGCSGCQSLDIQVHNFPTGTYTYECHDNSGSGGSDTVFFSHSVTVSDPNQSSWPGVFCYDSAPYTAYLVMDGVTSNAVGF
jgi:uncharacterized membrane protein YgcG